MAREAPGKIPGPLLANLREIWERHLLNAVAELPTISRSGVIA